MMGYVTTKTYTHETGLSCCFRQWRAAPSHCAKIHGYALAVELEFAATELDNRNWVVDFGGMKEIKSWLQDQFDHTLVIAQDDPLLHQFQDLDAVEACTLRVLPNVGCEAFAKHIHTFVRSWLFREGHSSRVSLRKVTVREHGGNSCSYEP